MERLADTEARYDMWDPECGRTALMVAARDGHRQSVELLLAVRKGVRV